MRERAFICRKCSRPARWEEAVQQADGFGWCQRCALEPKDPARDRMIEQYAACGLAPQGPVNTMCNLCNGYSVSGQRTIPTPSPSSPNPGDSRPQGSQGPTTAMSGKPTTFTHIDDEAIADVILEAMDMHRVGLLGSAKGKLVAVLRALRLQGK